MVDEKVIDNDSGYVIRLFEDSTFQIVNPTTGERLTPDQVLKSQQSIGNYLVAYGVQWYLWKQVWRAAGAELGPIPYVGPYGQWALQKGGDILGAATAAGQQYVKIEAAQEKDNPFLAPLTTPIPPPGTVRIVVYDVRENGEIWNLTFGWTPAGDLYLIRGWYRYK